MYYVYFLKSLRNGKIYVGYTAQEVSSRLDQHNIGTNSWTKQNRPFELVYYEKYHCKKDAQAREIFYKSGFGKKIKRIIIANLGACSSAG